MIVQHRWFLHRVLLFAVLAGASATQAVTPLGTGFTYQGQLKQSGTPVTGTANFQFSLWDALTGPNQVGSTQTINGVSVTGGLFTVTLNASSEFGATAFNGEQRWLEISVNGTPLTPRQEVTAAPNALFSLNADRLDGLDSTAFLQSIPVPLTLSGTSATHIIRGENASATNDASGVYGLSTAASGLTSGGRFESAGTSGGTGVVGEATATTGSSFGGRFFNHSPSGAAVLGQANDRTGSTYGGEFLNESSSGIGALCQASAGDGTNYGVWGQSNSTSGTGVYGVAAAFTGATYGVYGQSGSPSGRGVYGIADNLTGFNVGGEFETNSTDGRGVRGAASATTGVAVGGRFSSASTSGRGVWSTANAATGITYGVYGESNSPSGYDFYAAGVGLNYGAASSRRWKRNIEPIGQPLDKLGRLRGVYFNWNADHGGRHDVGMIAEEVGAVLPEIVNYEENGIDAAGMDYSKMTPLLVEAVNALRAPKDGDLADLRAEQHAELAALRAEKDAQICQQRETINGLIARLERLEKVMSQTGQARKDSD